MKRITSVSAALRGGRSLALSATAAVLFALTLPLVGLGAASAAPSHWETFDETWGPQPWENFCGVPGLTLIEQGGGQARSRTTIHASDGLPYDAGHAEVTDTWTNAAGEVVYNVASNNSWTHKITDNGDGTLTIVEMYTANETYIYDGQVIAKSTGRQGSVVLWDHAGTPADTSDDVFLAILDQLRNTGHTPDFCDVLVGTLG